MALSTVHSNSLLYFLLFCETRDLVWEIISVSEKRMKNCIVKIIDNVFEINDEGGLFPLTWSSYYWNIGAQLKEITHLRHFSKTLLIIFTIQFFILFSEIPIISQTKSWVSQNNIKYKSKFEVNRTQRYDVSQSHSSCCELIGHRRATDEVVHAAGLRIV